MQLFAALADRRHTAPAGVPILAGTDVLNPFCSPGFSLHDELALLVEAGLTPMQALQTATLNPAIFLNATDSLGTVETGKLADLVLLDADPLADIHDTTRISAVVLNGQLLDAQQGTACSISYVPRHHFHLRSGDVRRG